MDDLIQFIKAYNAYIVAIMAGGIAYTINVLNGEKFGIWRLLFNFGAAFFVGYLTGKFIPDALSQSARDGVISLSGFLAFPILQLLKRDGVSILAQRFGISAAITPQPRQMPQDTILPDTDEGGKS